MRDCMTLTHVKYFGCVQLPGDAALCACGRAALSGRDTQGTRLGVLHI